jgi:hypothetical protein
MKLGETGRNSWHIRDYRDGDEVGMNDLFNMVFSLNRPLAHWFWKFDDNPHKPNKYICLAEKDAKIMAMYPCLPSYFKYFDERCVALQAVDNCVHHDLRKGLKREGIFLKVLKGLIEQAKRKGCAFGFGFPTDEHFRYGEKKLGYIYVGKLPTMRKSLSDSRGGVWTRFKKRIRRNREEGFSVTDVRDFSGAFDQLWLRAKDDYPIAMERDAKFLNWRYISNPTGEYKCLAVYQEGHRVPCGYAVGLFKGGGDARGYIYDFLLKGPRRAGLVLLERLEAYFRSAGAGTVECRMFEHVPMYEILSAAGYGPAPEAVNVNAYLFDGRKVSDAELGRKRNWHLTLGDSDTE